MIVIDLVGVVLVVLGVVLVVLWVVLVVLGVVLVVLGVVLVVLGVVVEVSIYDVLVVGNGLVGNVGIGVADLVEEFREVVDDGETCCMIMVEITKKKTRRCQYFPESITESGSERNNNQSD